MDVNVIVENLSEIFPNRDKEIIKKISMIHLNKVPQSQFIVEDIIDELMSLSLIQEMGTEELINPPIIDEKPINQPIINEPIDLLNFEVLEEEEQKQQEEQLANNPNEQPPLIEFLNPPKPNPFDEIIQHISILYPNQNPQLILDVYREYEGIINSSNNPLEKFVKLLTEAVTREATQNENPYRKQIQKIIYDQETLIQKVIEVLPDINKNWLLNEIDRTIDFERQEQDLYTILMDHIVMGGKEYPRAAREQPKPLIVQKVNWFEDKTETDEEYRRRAITVLSNDFLNKSDSLIRRIFQKNKYRYSPSYLELTMNSSKLKWRTRKPRSINRIPQRLREEIRFVQEKEREKREEQDRILAEKLNQQQYDEAGFGIECGCCFTEVPFESMVSCTNGHLVCSNCLKRSVEVAIGSNRTVVQCLETMDECDRSYSMEMIQKAIPIKTWNTFQRLVQADSIREAGLEDLRKCPFCEYAVIIPEGIERLLECKNPECMKITCLECKELDHTPLTCEDYKKQKIQDKHSDIRTLVEEEMTKALLRCCNKCSKAFYKLEGCNKITCSCGNIQCYLCNKNINQEKYGHFSDAEGRCPLWSSEEADEEMVKKAEQEAKIKAENIIKKRLQEEEENKLKKENEQEDLLKFEY